MTKRILLAVDLSYQSYRSAAANPQLRNVDRVFTGGLFGFLVSMARAVLTTQATTIAICRDSKPYVRSKTYPEYKMLRAKNKDPELKERAQLTEQQVLTFCESLGWPVFAFPGFESDDCIASLALQHHRRLDMIYAASNDSDLYQLMDLQNFMIMKGSAVEEAVGIRQLKKLTGLTPIQYMTATALTGTHNDVAGIPGVGEVTALKIMKDPALFRQHMERHRAIIERNLELIRLPHQDFPGITSLPRVSQRFDMRRFYKMLSPFDIKATPAMLEAFERLGAWAPDCV